VGLADTHKGYPPASRSHTTSTSCSGGATSSERGTVDVKAKDQRRPICCLGAAEAAKLASAEPWTPPTHEYDRHHLGDQRPRSDTATLFRRHARPVKETVSIDLRPHGDRSPSGTRRAPSEPRAIDKRLRRVEPLSAHAGGADRSGPSGEVQWPDQRHAPDTRVTHERTLRGARYDSTEAVDHTDTLSEIQAAPLSYGAQMRDPRLKPTRQGRKGDHGTRSH